MKKVLLLIFALISLNAFSQLQVKEGSFVHVPGGVIEDKAEYTDGNELPMALIKISTENINEQERLRLVFTGNRATQIIKKPKTGQMWIYISAEPATFIDIKHPDYGTCKYYLPENLCDYCVYEMVLQYIPFAPAVEQKVQNTYLVVRADQDNALVYIDDEPIDTKEASKLLVVGTTHTWKIECNMYYPESGTVTVKERTVIEKELRPAFGYIDVTTMPEQGAKVFIDGEYVGVSPCKSDRLKSGNHTVRVMKDAYKIAEESFVVTDGQTTNADVVMVSNLVSVFITTDAQSDIYVDEVYKGRGAWSGRLPEGTHHFEARKENHRASGKNVNLVLGEEMDITLDEPKPINGSLDVNTSPMGAEIYVDGKSYGETPNYISEILIGEHELKLVKPNYSELKKLIFIKEGETLSLYEKLQQNELAINTSTSKTQKEVVKTPKEPKAPKTPKVKEQKPKQVDVYKKASEATHFATVNFACASTAFQKSYGLTYGSVKKVGWFASVMTNFNFKGVGFAEERPAELVVENMDGTIVPITLNGEQCSSRLSLTAGMVVKCFSSVYAKVGAGYGVRSKFWQSTTNHWYKHEGNSYIGADITAGLQFNLGGFVISTDVVTNNFKTLEVKLGLGLNWKK